MLEIKTSEFRSTRKEMLMSLELTPEESLQYYCEHRTEDDKQDTFRIKDDDVVICTKCGAKFTPLSEIKREFIQQDVDAVVNILETAKIYSKEHSEYFAIIPLLKRLPELYEILEAEFNKSHYIKQPTMIEIKDNLVKMFEGGE